MFIFKVILAQYVSFVLAILFIFLVFYLFLMSLGVFRITLRLLFKKTNFHEFIYEIRNILVIPLRLISNEFESLTDFIDPDYKIRHTYNLVSCNVVFEGDNPKVRVVLGILSTSLRETAAHYNNNSFSINSYILDKDDEYNMANSCLSPDHFNVSINIPKELKNIEMINYRYIVIGEDLMLGSYLVTKLGGEKHDVLLLSQILNNVLIKDSLSKRILDSGKEYFDFCISYGSLLAKKIPYGSTT